ncbi:MAG: DUF1206 domain-containing protein [Frankiaceae bacterium]
MGPSAGTSHHPSAHEAEATAKRAGDSHWVDRLARLGLAARGLIYLMVGYFALQIAFGHSSRRASRNGAFHAIAEKSWGPALLWVMALGFFGYALWRLTEAIWGHADEDSTAKKVGKRLFSLFRAVVYAFIGYSAASLASGSGGGSGGGGSNKQAQSGTAHLLKQSWGVPLLVAIGAAFIIGGAILAYRGLKTKFEKKLKTEQMSERTRKVVEKVGMFGMAARGTVAALIGIFLIQAALTFDPKKAKGLDGSLRTLAQTGWGKFVLVIVALGLVAFGVYSFAEARYRRTGKEKGGSGSASGGGYASSSGSSGASGVGSRAG